MNKQLEQLKIKQAVLKVVRKISGVAFNPKLGDEYNICFTLTKEIGVISMYATRDGEHIKCFDCGYNFRWQASFPKKESEIPSFEREVEKGLAEIFEFIKGDK